VDLAIARAPLLALRAAIQMVAITPTLPIVWWAHW
jgi:hypothetical protein